MMMIKESECLGGGRSVGGSGSGRASELAVYLLWEDAVVFGKSRLPCRLHAWRGQQTDDDANDKRRSESAAHVQAGEWYLTGLSHRVFADDRW